MAFTPIDLPIQQLLMSNFVTDIASITNSNALLLEAQIEDLINNFEIDTNGLSIGTDNPISYIRTQSLIMRDQGFIFQAGSPTPTTIASLATNLSGQSVLTVDVLNVNVSSGFDDVTLNTLAVNTSSSFSGLSTFNGPVKMTQSVHESKENVVVDLESQAGATYAEGTLTLSSTSRQNIYLTLRASTSPTSATPVYNGSSILPTIGNFTINIDFDSVSPPEENMVFTIHFVGVTETNAQADILSSVQLAGIPIYLVGGTNQFSSNTIVMHDNTRSVGIQNSGDLFKYGSNISFMYIKDATLDDRLIVKSLVGAELF